MISVRLCQGATCPELEAAAVIYFFSLFFHRAWEAVLFSRRLIGSAGLWSERERWHLNAEDVQPCGWVGFEGGGGSWSLREGFFFAGGGNGSGTTHLAEGAAEMIPTSSLTVGSSVASHWPYLNYMAARALRQKQSWHWT